MSSTSKSGSSLVRAVPSSSSVPVSIISGVAVGGSASTSRPRTGSSSPIGTTKMTESTTTSHSTTSPSVTTSSKVCNALSRQHSYSLLSFTFDAAAEQAGVRLSVESDACDEEPLTELASPGPIPPSAVSTSAFSTTQSKGGTKGSLAINNSAISPDTTTHLSDSVLESKSRPSNPSSPPSPSISSGTATQLSTAAIVESNKLPVFSTTNDLQLSQASTTVLVTAETASELSSSRVSSKMAPIPSSHSISSETVTQPSTAAIESSGSPALATSNDLQLSRVSTVTLVTAGTSSGLPSSRVSNIMPPFPFSNATGPYLATSGNAGSTAFSSSQVANPISPNTLLTFLPPLGTSNSRTTTVLPPFPIPSSSRSDGPTAIIRSSVGTSSSRPTTVVPPFPMPNSTRSDGPTAITGSSVGTSIRATVHSDPSSGMPSRSPSIPISLAPFPFPNATHIVGPTELSTAQSAGNFPLEG